MLELVLGIAPQQVAIPDVLDQISANIQVTCHIADNHAARQLQCVSLEQFGVAPPWVGEGDINLTHQSTCLALYAWDGGSL
jgi:hypothetical protein